MPAHRVERAFFQMRAIFLQQSAFTVPQAPVLQVTATCDAAACWYTHIRAAPLGTVPCCCHDCSQVYGETVTLPNDLQSKLTKGQWRRNGSVSSFLTIQNFPSNVKTVTESNALSKKQSFALINNNKKG